MSGIGPISSTFASSELDYVELTSNVAIISTSSAAPTLLATSNSIILDGKTKIRIEFFASAWAPPAAGGIAMNAILTEIAVGAKGKMGALAIIANGYAPFYAVRFLTPSAGAHQYTLGAYCASSSGNVYVGDGLNADNVPGFLRISRA